MIARTMPTYHALGSSRNSQSGGALLVMLVILVIGITTAFVTSLSSTAINNKRNQTTAEALAQAKEALIGYAVTYGDTHPGKTHGYLSCPDLGSLAEGTAPSECALGGTNELGRLPWRTLGLPALFDGAGECLWYAVSGNYGNKSLGLTMNWDAPVQLHLYGSDGNEIAANEIVALVIAPGSPVSGNSDRAGSSAPICGGNYTAAAYLDSDSDPSHGTNYNNAVATGKFILQHEHRDANGNVTLTVNDQFAIITRQDIWTAIQKRIAREAKECLDGYANTSGGKYPWAVPVSTPTAFSPLVMGEYNTLFGRLPTRPNVQDESTPTEIVTMQARFAELWSALATFEASKTAANLTLVKSRASAAKNAADIVGDNYDDTELEPPADVLEDSAKDVQDNLTVSTSSTDIVNIQNAIIGAANDFTSAMAEVFSQDDGMEKTWRPSCTLFSSAQWEHWKDLVFYQIADGFKPSGTAVCGNCLSVEGSGHNLAGSGTYRATVIVAGKKLTATRTLSNVDDYLEPDNTLPKDDYTKPYKTHRITDAAYQTVNDFVLCLDGVVSCQ